MADRDAEFESLCREVDLCRECRKDPGIHALEPAKFMFHWKPYWLGEPPFSRVLLAWEPGFAAVVPEETYPVQGGFNEPLQYAVRKFLLNHTSNKGFLITNMAKCTIRTGPLCNSTREFRFRSCKGFLDKELSLAADSASRFVSIGRAPISYMEAHSALYGEILKRIHKITHYGARRFGHFRQYAKARPSEFAEFRGSIEPDYVSFFRHRHQTNEEFGWYYDHLQKNLEGDIEMLFLWHREMLQIPR
jgi:hypothetical protein